MTEMTLLTRGSVRNQNVNCTFWIARHLGFRAVKLFPSLERKVHSYGDINDGSLPNLMKLNWTCRMSICAFQGDTLIKFAVLGVALQVEVYRFKRQRSY